MEGDFTDTDLSGRGHYTGFNGDRSNLLSRNNYLATARGRIGWAAPAGLLLYGTGGYATTEIKNQALFLGPLGRPLFAGVHEYHPDGWVAGAGVEYEIPSAVLARYGGFLAHSAVTTRVEWLHYEFNGKDLNIAALPGGAGGYVGRFDNQADVIRAGINYKF